MLRVCDMAVYFDYKIPTRYPGCHDLIEWHKAYSLLAVSFHCSTTTDASVEFYKDEVSLVILSSRYRHTYIVEDFVILLVSLKFIYE